MSLFRFIYIIYIALKYRLDQFFSSRTIRVIQFILAPLRLISFTKLNRAERLRISLESLGPIFVKFGQMLSTRRDLLPTDIADELAKLQDQVPPFEYQDVKKIVETTYKTTIEKQFRNFEKLPVASASVAQVHYAELVDGKEVAVKILRPNIKQQVKRDIQLLYWIASILEFIWADGKRLRPKEVVTEFSKHTTTELNLLLEAGHCSHLYENFQDKKLLIVPEVFWDFCHENIMVMERMDGIPVSNIKELNKHKIDIPKLARDGVDIFFTQVFRDGFFHADMHPGNIQVAKDGRYIALDFGIMGTLNESDKHYLARNFVCFFKKDYRGVAEAHLESGWVPKNTSVDEFENAIRSVCEPIFNKPLKDISFGKLLIRLFQTSRQFNMEIQPQLTMLQKTLLNVEGLGRELDPNLDLWVTARPFLEKWLKEQTGPKKIIQSLKKEMPQIIEILPKFPKLIEAFLKNNSLESTLEIKKYQQDIKALKSSNKYVKIICTIIFILFIIQFYLLIF